MDKKKLIGFTLATAAAIAFTSAPVTSSVSFAASKEVLSYGGNYCGCNGYRDRGYNNCNGYNSDNGYYDDNGYYHHYKKHKQHKQKNQNE